VTYLKLGFLLAGVALLGVIVATTDLAAAARLVARMDGGLAVVLLIYFAAFAGDTASWHLAFRPVPMTLLWAWRLWLVRMVGEAFNNTLPAGGMGGEPVKAVMLKQRYGVAYQQGAASLFLTKTVNMIALVAFLAVGFVMMQGNAQLTPPYKAVAAVGLGALAGAILVFFAIQRYRLSSAIASWLAGRTGGLRLARAVDHIGQVEAQFVAFYTRSPARFGGALALAFGNWLLGVAEIYYALLFIGHPVAWQDAWIIEAAAQLIRTGTFFIPASLGAQEGVFLLLCGAIVGSPTAGIALALVRRIREIVWISSGFAISALLKPAARPADTPPPRQETL
jgi:uncharacterized protein (TIRG00374 family)